MPAITVSRTIPGPIDKVFDILTDHANFQQFPGILESNLEKQGSPSPNGVGAIRYIKVKQGWFREEIKAYDRPSAYTYLITQTSLPLKHEGGTLTFKSVAGGTEVVWVSDARMTVPLIGGLLDKLFAPMLKKGFAATLKDVERRLAA